MSFFVNLGHAFKVPESFHPEGSVILAASMPKHQLERRTFSYRHLAKRLFDPQLYLSGLEVPTAPEFCTKLATYPWFGVEDLEAFDSGEHTQSSWRQQARASIASRWTGTIPNEPAKLLAVTRQCIEFQLGLGCWAVVLPSPLTVDPGTDYAPELAWLDAGLESATDLGCTLPVYATVAVSDICTRFQAVGENALLSLVLDAVSAREVDGVYIVIEQASEPDDTRQCANTRTLSAVLRLVAGFGQGAGLTVGVNFLGAFGLVCQAVGASWWASNWYKSLYRLRLADKVAGGRAYPSYWSFPMACDIHLESDLSGLVAAGMLSSLSDSTTASAGLLAAAASGLGPPNVPAWIYRPSNVSAAIEHYLLSSVLHEGELVDIASAQRLGWVKTWLERALGLTQNAVAVTGPTGKTKTNHVLAWHDAFEEFASDHG